MKTILTNEEVMKRAMQISEFIRYSVVPEAEVTLNIYAIPRGGVPAAYLILKYLENCKLVEDPKSADVFIDDIYDSGVTMMEYIGINPTAFFLRAC